MVERLTVVEMLTALAHEARLGIFELLMRAGSGGLAAGEIGAQLSISPNALSFHLNRLKQAAMVASRRQGRQIIYVAEFARAQALTAFFTDNCCRDDPAGCTDECPQPVAAGKGRV